MVKNYVKQMCGRTSNTIHLNVYHGHQGHINVKYKCVVILCVCVRYLCVGGKE